ncbi:heme-binding protein [Arthrobacter sp. Helios]|uniref:GlcG/HbpS family heme-binding protein n=1 Tax=Arthrobacter sp. Helios TaxID=2828862 RepID=UPI00205D8A3D|nr:heme-binding protein [Arthrobacter sp. Helios]UPO78604.1 heme-binding protein [Arthrobacter sp. Helios]
MNAGVSAGQGGAGIFQRPTLSHESASSILQAVLGRTHQQDGIPVGVACAIVGSFGELIAFGAQDSCGALPRKLAARKAYTALILRRPTAEVKEAAAAGQIDLDRLNDPELTPTLGGAPLFINGVIVGAIGISGLPPSGDAAVAEKAAAEFNATVTEPAASH